MGLIGIRLNLSVEINIKLNKIYEATAFRHWATHSMGCEFQREGQFMRLHGTLSFLSGRTF